MGKYLDMVRQAKEIPAYQSQAGERVQTPPAGVVAPGCLITWQGAEGKPRGPATVDFLHTDPEDTVWAFVTYQGTWRAVSERIIVTIEPPESPSVNREGGSHGP